MSRGPDPACRDEQSAESVTDVLIEGLAYYPHYFSTYCIHGLHERCRLTCKHCEKPCLCRCHRAAHIDG